MDIVQLVNSKEHIAQSVETIKEQKFIRINANIRKDHRLKHTNPPIY